MKETNALQELLTYCDEYESMAAAARSLGVSRQYLNDIVNNKRDLSRGLLAKLGLKRVVVKEKTA